ncbi:MAG: peptidase MA domain-containing protein [Dehalococcoidales bacterium]|nr:peptidase MA domain-containing protein [Dehalococcoidales bacterium]
MLKRLCRLLLTGALLAAVLSPATLQAQDGITVSKNTAVVGFPISIGFSLAAASDSEITDIRLHYTTNRQSFAQVTSEVYIDFAQSKDVDIYWALDMARMGGLPPGVMIDYWWTLADADGSRLQTEAIRINYDDNQHDWKSLAQGDITLYWYNGDQAFAGELMGATQAALVRLQKDTGAHLTQAIDLYIYANAEDLRASMINSSEWTGGVAFTRYNTISIGIASYNLAWGKRAIIHELAHMVTHQMTFNPYSTIPTWLNEGLSMYAEGDLDSVYRTALLRAIAGETLISVRGLSSPFSAFTTLSYQSYAQSYSLVSFLISEYSEDSMFQLLGTFKQGASYDDAFLSVYGFNLDDLNDLWRDYVSARDMYMNVTLISLIVLVTGGFIIAVFWLWWRPRRV